MRSCSEGDIAVFEDMQDDRTLNLRQCQGRGGGLPPRSKGQPGGMRFGNVEIRPLGGGLGCLLMVLISVIASVLGTVLLNLLLR